MVGRDHKIHDTDHKFTPTEIWDIYQNFFKQNIKRQIQTKNFKKWYTSKNTDHIHAYTGDVVGYAAGHWLLYVFAWVLYKDGS
jgi:hypothetical protein